MVKIQDIASSLEEGLDLLSDTYEFTIKPLIGEYETPVDIRKEQLRKKPKIIINGDLLPIPSSIVPVQNLNNVYMSANLQFIVKEEYAKDIYGILCAYVEENVGTAVSFSEYIGIVTFTVPVAGDAGVRPNVGSSVPIMVTVSYQFVKNGLLSNGCKLILDGEELLALTFGISRTRVQQTDNLLAGSEMQSVIGQQGLKISVTMPYTKKDVMRKLMDDILAGGLSTTYTLSYADGFSGGGNWLVVMQSGSASYESGKVPSIEADFLIARSDIY